MEMLDSPQWTMRALNGRLKGFLEQVNRLQESNRQLEGQIADWGQRNVLLPRDWSLQERNVGALRTQVGKLLMENAQLALQSDSIKNQAAHIQTRWKAEERWTSRLEEKVAQLRVTKSKAELENRQLEEELAGSLGELEWVHHEQQALQQQRRREAAAGGCNVVVVASAPGDDGRAMELTQLLDSIRTQCDRLDRAPRWAPGGALTQLQEETAWAQVSQGGAALQEARAELMEARKQWHCLQAEIESLHALEKGLESSLHHTELQYSSQLQDLSAVVRGLEGELEDVRGGLVAQRERHHRLLNTKMRLEHEIATYRRLLTREEGRYHGRNGQVVGLKPWKGPGTELRENGLENVSSTPYGLEHPGKLEDPRGTAEPGEAKALLEEVEVKEQEEPKALSQDQLEENEGKSSPGQLRRQQSLIILTDSGRNSDLKIATVKTQEILQGNVVQESAEGHGTVETEKIDEVIREWEGSFFKGNPKLRKKSVSLRFDLHMAAADEGCGQTRQDSLPDDVEVRLVMKRSRSIPTIAQ